MLCECECVLGCVIIIVRVVVSGCAWVLTPWRGFLVHSHLKKAKMGVNYYCWSVGVPPRGCLHPESKKKKNLALLAQNFGSPKRHTAEAGDEMRKKKRRSSEEDLEERW